MTKFSISAHFSIISAFIAFILLPSCHCLIHNLVIQKDWRTLFEIERFGFDFGGEMSLNISGFHVKNSRTMPTSRIKTGFVMRMARSESDLQQDLEDLEVNGYCIFDKLQAEDFVVDMSDRGKWKRHGGHRLVSEDNVGLYALIFARCKPKGDNHPVSFRLRAEFFNSGPNYLSAGDAPLPSIYFSFSCLYLIVLVGWIWLLGQSERHVHSIHQIMTGVIVLKLLTLLSEAARLHYMSITGSSELWNIIYYILTFMKGLMLFMVIALIGTGWSLVKPYLNDKEKKIMVVVFILQVIDNIAMIIMDEMAPGSQTWLFWRDMLYLVDIFCCVAVLMPIAWSITNLKQASTLQDKQENNIHRLQQFRWFYISVIFYVYFTRIIVLLVEATLPYRLLWMSLFIAEFVTFVFYVGTGYVLYLDFCSNCVRIKFRPSPSSMYSPVAQTDLNELGLEEEEEDSHGSVELARHSSVSRAAV